VRRDRDRDEEFRAFYFSEVSGLRRLALLMTGDPHRAEDLTHDALLRAYKSWTRIRSDDPKPYVRKALINGCRNHLRRKAVEARKQPAPFGDSADQSPSLVEALRVAAALSRLSPVRRAVILLRFYEDLPEAVIASTLERPLNTVKSDIRRALQELKPILDESVRETT
jgi:RNA polymerase sigma-70 factor (sigma-E family)